MNYLLQYAVYNERLFTVILKNIAFIYIFSRSSFIIYCTRRTIRSVGATPLYTVTHDTRVTVRDVHVPYGLCWHASTLSLRKTLSTVVHLTASLGHLLWITARR